MLDKETNTIRREVVSYAAKNSLSFDEAIEKIKLANKYRKVMQLINAGEFIHVACAKIGISTKTYYKLQKLFVN